MGRIYDIVFACGCIMSLDGGGGLISCHSDSCVHNKYLDDGTRVTKEMIQKWDKEIERRNSPVECG